MKAFFRSIFLLLVCAAGLGSSAQEITFQATVDKNSASTGEPIKLTLTLTNAPMGSGITPPDMGGLVVVQGPFDQNSFSMVNGRTSSSVMRTYYVQGVQPGDYTIGAATARVGGGTIQSSPIKIHLVKGESSGTNSSLLNQAQKSDPNLFCTISLNKSKLYVGEQIIATYTLYSRYNSLQPGDYDLPKLDGFWAEEIDLGETTWEKQPQTINGLRYNTAVIKKQVLFPQRPGKLRIAPMTLNYRVNVGFFNNGTPVTITSNAAEVTALDLPPGKPADFIGAVGDLKMDVKVPTTEVKANEAIDLTIRFTGRANLKLIDAPELGFPTDFESYDPKITDKIAVNGGGMSGTREFQYLIIPRHEGDYTVGPITFSYFDPSTAQYRSLSSESLEFRIAKGDGTANMPAGPSRTEVKQLHQDIRYIRTGDLQLEPKGHHLFGSWYYVAGMAAPPLLFLLFLGIHRRRQVQLSDAGGMRRKGADRIARQRLKAAADALMRNDRDGFYSALGKALEGYFADKFNLGVTEVNSTTVHERLSHLEGGALAKQYAELLHDCGTSRFAPIENKPRQQSYDEAASLIHRIEEQL
jgi:hypothetical protein